MTVLEYAALKETDRDHLLLDVREIHEYDEYNLGGTLIPLGDIMMRSSEIRDWEEKTIVVHCRSGKRSAMAQQLLQQTGFKDVHNLEGGVLAWQEQFPV